MKSTFSYFLYLLLLPAILSAQTVVDHPIKLVNSAVEANEFLIFHTDGMGNSNPNTETTIGRYDPAGTNAEQRILEGSSTTNPASLTANGSKFLNAITLDYNGDSYDEPVVVVEKANGAKAFVLPGINKATLTGSIDPNATEFILPTPGNGGEIVKLAKGDFDNDGREELVVLTRADQVNGGFWLEIYGVISASSPNNLSRLKQKSLGIGFLPLSNSDDEAFDLAVGDFDNDGAPDLAIVAFEQGATSRQCFLQLYQVEPPDYVNFFSYGIVTKGKLTITPTGSSSGWENVGIVSHSPFAGPDQLCVSVIYEDPNNPNLMHREVYSIITDPTPEAYSLDSPTILATPYTNDIQNGGDRIALSMASGDLANIEEDMVAIAWDGEVRIFSPYDVSVSMRASSSGGTVQDQFYQLVKGNQYLSIGDMDYDKSQEILIVTTDDDGNSGNEQHFLRTTVLGLSQSLDALSVKGQRDLQFQPWAGASSDYHFAACVGEFQGGRAILKEPTMTSKTIFTPLIVNNAPPHHFDILGTLEADILEAYPVWPTTAASGTISSLYGAVSSTSQTLETELTSDWGVSATLSAGVSKLGNGVKASITGKYGEEFSQTQMTTETVTISTLSTALSDDQVYGTVQEYDIYEYPVDSSGHTIGYVLAMVREGSPIIQWMDSKSVDALNYLPDHEPGNLLSYPSSSNFDSYAGVSEEILTGVSTNIGSGGGLTFEMKFEDFASNSASTTKTFGAEVTVSASASFKYFDLGLDVTGTYNQSEMTTHTSTAYSEISLTSDLNRSLDQAFTDATYTVTPKAYWAENGALTLGYAVDPSLGSQGVNTFWTDHYQSNPDFSLILPWRLDAAKGFALGSTADKARLSKSISLSRSSFATGDTILIHAFVQNYSFLTYTGGVEFQFYAGNPDNGGILLEDIHGQTILTHTDVYEARERTPIVFLWKVPAGINPDPRIYVVIDPANKITEIHEDNNIGFRAGTAGPANSVHDELADSPIQTKLYPNPVSDRADLEIQLPSHGLLDVQLFNLQGQLMQTVYHKELHRGNFILPMNLATLPNGYYWVKVRFNQQQQIVKLMKAN
ncbi:MAG: T9SS type A sorting domain-containing protein [Bacteroidota bacterium]